jgi:hypothetical protein
MDIKDVMRDRDVPDITITERSTCKFGTEVFEYETLFSVVPIDGLVYVERRSRVLTDDEPKWDSDSSHEFPMSDLDTLISGFKRIREFLRIHLGNKTIYNIID